MLFIASHNVACCSVYLTMFLLDWVDYLMLAAYTLYQICFLVLPLRTIIHYELPTASAVVVVSEQVSCRGFLFLFYIYYTLLTHIALVL